NCSCVRDDNTRCVVKEGLRTCGYEGWVGQCEQKYDRCEEFVDPNDTSGGTTEGRTYYYINDTRIDGAACNGQASLGTGGVLFDQTSEPKKLFDATATYQASHLKNGDSVTPVKTAGNDSNRILKVRQDRECTEWLTCASYSPIPDPKTGKILRRCNQVES